MIRKKGEGFLTLGIILALLSYPYGAWKLGGMGGVEDIKRVILTGKFLLAPGLALVVFGVLLKIYAMIIKERH